LASLNHFTVPVSMVLLCFLYVEIALNFRWTSAGRSRKCGIACCRVPLNQTHHYCKRRSQERLDFGALPLWLCKRRVGRTFLFENGPSTPTSHRAHLSGGVRKPWDPTPPSPMVAELSRLSTTALSSCQRPPCLHVDALGLAVPVHGPTPGYRSPPR